jgi:hypothetical protein
VTDPTNGSTSAPTEADPETITTSETDRNTRDEGDARFLRRVVQGKAIGVVDPWGDERDELTSMQQLDRAIDMVHRVVMKMLGRRS